MESEKAEGSLQKQKLERIDTAKSELVELLDLSDVTEQIVAEGEVPYFSNVIVVR
jgi:hypothetical protein